MKDLTTKEGRIAEMAKIENSLLSALKEKGIEISPDAVCNVNNRSIEIGIAATGAYKGNGLKMAFASDIQINIASSLYNENEVNIIFGSCGSFDPSVKESYWRTIHAASILKNWDAAIEICQNHCKMASELFDECLKLDITI